MLLKCLILIFTINASFCHVLESLLLFWCQMQGRGTQLKDIPNGTFFLLLNHFLPLLDSAFSLLAFMLYYIKFIPLEKQTRFA